MKIVQLKFDSKKQALDVIRLSPDVILIVEIGVLYTKEQRDHDDNVITESIVQPGWHVDLMLNDGCTFFDTYAIDVVTPVHAFAL